MSYSTIKVRREGETGWVLIARPEVKNALNVRFFDEIHGAVSDLAQDESVRTIALMGEGGIFSAGRDFKDREVPPDFEERRARAFSALEYCAKPTIAAVSGYAITGGLTLATACDLIIAGEDAVFQDTHASFGITSMRASRLVELVGLQRAKELLFTCRRIDAREALAIGLVCKVVPPDRLESEARAMAAGINGHDQMAVRAMKQVINEVVRKDQKGILDMEELYKRRYHDLRSENSGLDNGLAYLGSRGAGE
ncbi:MAG: enoyl-CoA hydratase/isomerase family protein [Candidimonas sp.]|jgi:enoyl-CoA hydratase